MDDHAEYILRGFNVSGGHLVEDTLRNTPDDGAERDRRHAVAREPGLEERACGSDQPTVRTVDPVVFRASRSRCACAASRSG